MGGILSTMVSVIVFAFGLAVGSFLNAVIYRLAVHQGLYPNSYDRRNRGINPFQGRSFCPSCGHQLAWYDLVPLVSYLLLRGRCRYCGQRISLQYPFVELATGLLFVLIFAKLGLAVENLAQLSFPQAISLFRLIYLWAIAGLLVAIFVYDLKHFIIPDRFVYPAIAIAAAFRVFEALDQTTWEVVAQFWFLAIRAPTHLIGALAAAFLAFGFFFALHTLSRGKWMGFGDVKLALFMGLFLGFPNILVALACAFVLGALVGIVLILAKKKTMRSQVPFGPFLVLGTFVALFWGGALVDFYLSLLLV